MSTKHLLASAFMAIALVAQPDPVSAAAKAKPLFQTPTTDWVALRKAADRDGSVPVIVQLDVDALQPAALGASARRNQNHAIKQTRTALLDDLAGSDLRGLKTMDGLPLIAFVADADDLKALKASDDVRAVTIDRLVDVELEAGGEPAKLAKPSESGADVAAGSVSGNSWRGYDADQLPGWWDYWATGLDKTRAAGWMGNGQTVVVLDTGVEKTHSWITGRVVAEACFSTVAVGQTVGHCPNGRNQMVGAGAATPCGYHSLCAHGTHVAHTAAGLYGTAPNAKIAAIQIFHQDPVSRKPTYYESDLVFALSHVYYQLRPTLAIAAINMSIGDARQLGACDNSASDTSINATYLAGWINALKSVGIPTVVASGNEGYSGGISRPACITNAIAVGNTTLDANNYDAIYNGSNSGAMLDLLAPGTDICSAVLNNRSDCSYTGTSMAAPHVAGAMAVLRQKRPNATVDQLVYALQVSGTGVTDTRNNITRTRIHVMNALGWI